MRILVVDFDQKFHSKIRDEYNKHETYHVYDYVSAISVLKDMEFDIVYLGSKLDTNHKDLVSNYKNSKKLDCSDVEQFILSQTKKAHPKIIRK